MEFTKETAKIMAAWWGDRVRTATHHDNGDDSLAGLLSGLLADNLNGLITDEMREKFVDILSDSIMKEYEKKGYIPSYLLDCDYAPSKMLADAAKEAGISLYNFPWKTCMQEYDGRIMVRAGYGQPWEQIWPEINECA